MKINFNNLELTLITEPSFDTYNLFGDTDDYCAGAVDQEGNEYLVDWKFPKGEKEYNWNNPTNVTKKDV